MPFLIQQFFLYFQNILYSFYLIYLFVEILPATLVNFFLEEFNSASLFFISLINLSLLKTSDEFLITFLNFSLSQFTNSNILFISNFLDSFHSFSRRGFSSNKHFLTLVKFNTQ
jgi:hypothetical protein